MILNYYIVMILNYYIVMIFKLLYSNDICINRSCTSNDICITIIVMIFFVTSNAVCITMYYSLATIFVLISTGLPYLY